MAAGDRQEDGFSAAASLFGDETSNDLFSFASSPPAPPEPETDAVDSGLFGEANGQEHIFLPGDGNDGVQEESVRSSQESEFWEQQETEYDYSQQGYYDEEGTWHWYDVPATTEEYGSVDNGFHVEQSSQADHAPYPVENEHQAQYASYDPPSFQPSYHPASKASPAPSATYVPSYVSSATAYDVPPHPNALPASSTALYGSTISIHANGTNIYAPTSPYGTSSTPSNGPSNPYEPAASTASVYDPYKPAQSSRAPPPSRPQISHKHSSSYSYVYDQPPPAPKPAPPASTSSVKSALISRQPSNAYDPPLPPVTRSIYEHRSLTSPRGSFEIYPSSVLTPPAPPPPPGPPMRSHGPPALSPGIPPGPPSRSPLAPPPRSPFAQSPHHGPPPFRSGSGSSEGFSYYPEEPMYEPAASSFDALGLDSPPHQSSHGSHDDFRAALSMLRSPEQNAPSDLHEELPHEWQQQPQPIFSPEDEPNWGYPETTNTASHLDDVPEEAWPEPQPAEQTENLAPPGGDEGDLADDASAIAHPFSDSSHFDVPMESVTLEEPTVDGSEPAQRMTATSESYGLDDIPTFDDGGANADQQAPNAAQLESDGSPEELFDLSQKGNEHPSEVKDTYDLHCELPDWHPASQNPNWHYEPPPADYNKEPWLTRELPHSLEDDSGKGQEEINLDDTAQAADQKTLDPYAPPPASAPAPYAPPSVYVPPPPIPPPPAPVDWHTGSVQEQGPKFVDATALTEVYTSGRLVGTRAHDPYAPSSLRQAPEQPSQYPPSLYGQPRVVSPSPMASGYEPSTDRLGTDDPLGRIGRHCPVVAFAFGGKILTCFEQSSDVVPGLLSAHSRTVRISTLSAVIPPSAIDSSTTPFPGPLFQDPLSNTLAGGFARAGAGGASKSKKAALLKYLDERAAEIQTGVAYLSAGEERAPERRTAEGKLIIVQLLRILVEHDGRLSGSPVIDNAIRSALVSDGHSTSSDAASLATPAMFGMTYGTSSGPDAAPQGLMSPFMSSAMPDSDEDAVAVYRVRRVSLDKLQQLLLRGDRRSAVHYALDERLWAHALVISSSLDKDTWKEAVNEFIRSELGPAADHGPAGNGAARPSDGRESLRIAYSLFAGNGAASVQELLPPKLLMKGSPNGLLGAPTVPVSQVTPMSPNFPQPALASDIPAQSLEKWREAAATIMANQALGNSAALTALGDYLVLNNWLEAAHVCYLLSPQTSPTGAAGAPSVRMVLLGAANPAKVPNFHRDLDGVLLSEVLEFAYSLAPVAKGQEPYVGLTHLQPYRLLHALQLAEMGHTSVATRYVESIQQVVKLSGNRAQQLYSASFMAQLKDLQDRLTLAPQEDKLGFWGSKVPKPTLDSFGTWVGTNLTKFIAGEGDPAAGNSDEEDKRHSGQAQIGPFSHYSAISSAVPSTAPSPHGSTTNLLGTLSMSPTNRAGSAMSMRGAPPPPFAPIDRSASAMDRPKNRGASPPRTWSADALTTAFDQAGQHQEPAASGGWWNASGLDEDRTPTSSQFVPYTPQSGEPEGFISLMDSVAPSPVPMVPPRTHSRVDLEDEEDLGFGNSKNTASAAEEQAKEAEKESDQTEHNKETTPQTEAGEHARASSSWFRGWFGGAKKESIEAHAAPVRANLGEENAFYYDKDLKRWVNKKGGATAESPKPATPPPRAQTTSPGKTARLRDPPITSAPSTPAVFNGIGRGPPPPGAAGGPPRSMSAVPPRMRSNLTESFTAPAEGGNEGDTTPPTGGPPPRPATAGRSAGKKNVRSRYVDVFNQQQQ